MSWTNWITQATVGVALSVFAPLAAQAQESTPAPSENKASSVPAPDLGLWVWPRNVVENPDERAALLAFCEKNGVTRLLVQVHFEKGATPPRLAFPDALKDFLAKAAKLGIKVEALDGEPEMGLEADRAETLAKLDAVLSFNKDLPKGEGFAGVHYDIEPYLALRWRNGDQKAVASETLVTMKEIQSHVKASDPTLLLAYDIPMWYDAKDEELTVEFDGKTQNFHRHIQDLSDYVGIMSYRRKASGPNSVSDVCAAELAYAEKTGKKLYASLETLQLIEEPTITFYGQKPEDFLAVRDEVVKTMSASPAFGGVLMHHYGSVRDLLEGTKLIPEKQH